MEDSEAKCDKCESEVRPPTPTDKTTPGLVRPEALVALGQELLYLQEQNKDLMATLFGIGFIALCTVIKYTVFY